MTRYAGHTGQVIHMDRFRSGKSLSPIRQAEAYWCALRDGAAIPRRAQIDPRGLENILEYTFILERIAPGIARFRLAGNHLTELAKIEVRGMPLTSMFTAAARRQISGILEQVFDGPTIADLSLSSEACRGCDALDARMILLPLESDFGDVSRALGVIVTDGPIAGTKFVRFGLNNTRMRPTSGMAMPIVAEPEATPGFAEGQPQLNEGPPHLWLVK
jgi:hypothetical protein